MKIPGYGVPMVMYAFLCHSHLATMDDVHDMYTMHADSIGGMGIALGLG